jgi:hypothetical protein
MDWTPLEALPPAVEKVAGPKAPPPLKMMAARGLSPLKPGEMLTALYQLAQSDDPALKQAAQKTATELPEATLKVGLAEALDVRVLDFFARRLFQKPPLLEIVLLNKQTDDDTFRHLATICNENELELIARNEERLLRTPGIIAALYLNPKTRMSTAQRALELAVRNNVRVEGIAAFDEAKAAIEAEAGKPAADAAALDAAFKSAAEVAVDPMAALIVGAVDPAEEEAQLAAEEKQLVDALAAGEEPATEEIAEEKKKRLEELPIAAQIRAATLGNSFARATLIRSKNKQVAMACVKSPAVKDSEAMHWAANRSLDEDIIRYIANKRQWTRLYGVKVALCNNPKCPIPTAMGFLPHLRPSDLKAVSRSKGVPSAVANAAKQMLQARTKGKGGM